MGSARQEDFVFAEHVLRRGYATEEQVQECLKLLERLRGELGLEETLHDLLLKKGYLAPAQASVIQQDINPVGRAKNQIEGYRLMSRVGSGAMGSVYKAHHIKLDIPVALKVLRVDLAKSRTQIERLKREAQLAARLNHPNIVRSLDVGESNGFHYFAMEYVDGRTVRQVLRKGCLREKEALRIIRHVARALEHAHGQGVIHRDVKAGNIMLTSDGTVKLADLGLARGQEPSDLTLEHSAIGTPQYLAPEQARRGSDATGRSDLFSLGATLYHMVTGRPPFSGDNLGEIFRKVIHCEFDPPEQVVPDLTLDTVYLIHRLMRPNPRDRYASATELLSDLDRLKKGERIAPRDFKGDYREYLRRRRLRRGLIGTAAVLVVGASWLFVAQKLSRDAAEKAHLEVCTAINATAKDEIAELDTLAGLTRARNEMQRARITAACDPGALRDLDRRLAVTQSDIDSIKEAKLVLRESENPDADFRSVLLRLERIDVDRPGARRRLGAVRKAFHAAAADRVEERRAQIYDFGFESADATIAGLAAFERDLRTRYPKEQEKLAVTVAGQAKALRDLQATYRRAEGRQQPIFRNALAAHHFRSASRALETLKHEKWKAWTRASARQNVPRIFLDHFPREEDAREHSLGDAEGRYWRDLTGRVGSLVEEGRPDLALDELTKFEPKAHATKERVSELLKETDGKVARLLDSQNKGVGTLEAVFRRRLEDRAYAAAAREVDAARSTIWILDAKIRYTKLRARAQAVRRLLREFGVRVRKVEEVEVEGKGFKKNRVPGRAFLASPDDPDLFLVKASRRSEPVEVYLRDLAFAELLRILDFKDTDLMSGYLHAVEAFHQKNKKLALKHLLQGFRALRQAGDDWAEDVNKLIIKTQAEIRSSEARALALKRLYAEANGRRDHAIALWYCEELLKLRWTDTVTPGDVTTFTASKKKLVRLAHFDSRRQKSGIPPGNLVVLGDKGVRITYTGRPWHVLGNSVPEGQDRDKWLRENERLWWYGRFRVWGLDEERFPTLYERARRQLLDWNDDVESADGGYRLTGAVDHNLGIWWPVSTKQVDRRYRIATLKNHFELQRDWSVEFTVDWDWPVPGYFAIGAGKIQAGLAFAPPLVTVLRNAPSPETKVESGGGGAGACIFVDTDIVAGHVGRFSQFHWHMVNPPDDPDKRKKRRRTRIRRSHMTYLDSSKFEKGVPYFERDTPYRMRLERRKDRILFYATPLHVYQADKGFKGDPRTIQLVLKISSNEIQKATRLPADQPAFRFFGLKRLVLEDVVVEGYLPAANAQ